MILGELALSEKKGEEKKRRTMNGCGQLRGKLLPDRNN